jgi:hypothetical protein
MRIPAPTITFSPSRLPAMVLPLAFLLAELLPAQFGISLSPGFPVGHGGVIGQRPDPWAFVPTVQVDLDRDGQDELIATISWDRDWKATTVGRYSHFIIYEGDASIVRGTRPCATQFCFPTLGATSLLGTARGAPLITDSDRGGPLTIAFTTTDRTDNHRLRQEAWTDSLPRPGFPVDLGTGYLLGTSAAVDVNGDGLLEYVVAAIADKSTDDTVFWVMDRDGKIMGNQWPVSIAASAPRTGIHGRTCISVGDVDGDGVVDFFMQNRASQIVALDAKGQARPGWPVTIKSGYLGAGTTLADLDQDGKDEVLVSIFDANFSGPYGVQVFRADGTPFFAAPLLAPSNGYVVRAPAVADIDGDGKPDIVQTNRHYNVNGNGGPLHCAWSATGVLKPGFPVYTSGVNPGGCGYDAGSYGSFDAPVITDMDSNGLAEIMVAESKGFTPCNSYAREFWHISQGDGSVLRSGPENSGPRVASWRAGLSVGSLHGDGRFSIAMSSESKFDDAAPVLFRAYQTDQTFDQARILWNGSGGNLQRTGRYGDGEAIPRVGPIRRLPESRCDSLTSATQGVSPLLIVSTDTGDTQAGSTLDFSVKSAAPGSIVALVIGGSNASLPFIACPHTQCKLIPSMDILLFRGTPSVARYSALKLTLPRGLKGLRLWTQAIEFDLSGGGSCGFARIDLEQTEAWCIDLN